MTPSTTVAERDVEAFLDAVGGNYVAAYNEIVADQERRVLAAIPASNAEIRKAAYRAAVKNMDRKQLASMNKTVRSFLPLAKANNAITSSTGPLTKIEAEDLMVEMLEVKRLKEITKSREDEIRKRVFNSMTETFASQGKEFPEYVPGSIDLPKLGLKFTRERCGRKDPVLDEDRLEETVGPEIWEQVSTVEVIPAQEVRTVNMDLFLALARKKPALLELLREALVVGEFNSGALYVRNMDLDKE